MAKDKKLVEAITSMDEDFAQWYTDVVKESRTYRLFQRKGMYGNQTCMVMRSGKISSMSLTADSKRQV